MTIRSSAIIAAGFAQAVGVCGIFTILAATQMSSATERRSIDFVAQAQASSTVEPERIIGKWIGESSQVNLKVTMQIDGPAIRNADGSYSLTGQYWLTGVTERPPEKFTEVRLSGNELSTRYPTGSGKSTLEGEKLVGYSTTSSNFVIKMTYEKVKE